MKSLFIAEKPSVAREFAVALGIKGGAHTGYIESDDSIITWCVGHLVTMSYPDAYDIALKKWTMDSIPFIPDAYKYEIIKSAAGQFKIVKQLLSRKDVECIYVCTDSGREGEYIYRLVDQLVDVKDKIKKRVWIDSQTEEEILRGIREAKPLSEYDNLSNSAYLRAQEDYLMGINFSRVLTLKYSYVVKNYLSLDKCVIAVGRVMTCVLGMIVNREREIRDFIPTAFFRVVARIGEDEGKIFEAEWKAVGGTKYYNSPLLYKENGFKDRKTAEELIEFLNEPLPKELQIEKIEKKIEKKNPPMLYNLAELQNDCSKLFKISPSDTLKVVQELYEKKLVTYPRTDARVLSTAVSKEIYKNISGLKKYPNLSKYAMEIIEKGTYKNIAKTKYVNDKQITDHYAIIPTGQGFGSLNGLSSIASNIYELISRRFLSIFYPAAEYKKTGLILDRKGEKLFANFKTLKSLGYLEVAKINNSADNDAKDAHSLLEYAETLKKGMYLPVSDFIIKEGETTPPKRYSSGTLILAMENAGQFIEDEELRSQIKGSGIGTSATRDSIITKLVTNRYIGLNKKTQIVTPTFLGEIIYDVVFYSINGLLRADLTASWEKGLTGVAEGTITKEEYTSKMNDFVIRNTNYVKQINNQNQMVTKFNISAEFYKKTIKNKS